MDHMVLATKAKKQREASIANALQRSTSEERRKCSWEYIVLATKAKNHPSHLHGAIVVQHALYSPSLHAVDTHPSPCLSTRTPQQAKPTTYHRWGIFPSS